MGDVIRLLPLDGGWETLGADRYNGIVAEDIEAASDDWGPSTMRLSQKAAPGAQRPDLTPFTPIEYERDGLLAWSGFVWERPSSKNAFTVGCRGWQYHLDDDVLDRAYVHTRLSDYRDQRTFLTARLANFKVSGNVATDNGAIAIGWPQGAIHAVGDSVGVTLDLGPDSTGKRIVMEWESANNDANISCYVRGTPTEDPLGGTDSDFFTFTMGSGASGTSAGTAATAYRYVSVFLYRTAGSGALAADMWLKIKSLKLFRATAYESGNASILKADTVVKDARALAPLLNQTNDYITAGTFSIPEYLTGGYITPRQVAEAVNAFENYRLKIGGPDLKTLVFDAKPSTPLFEVGDWSGAEFNDSTVSGEEIHDTAVVSGTGPDGSQLVSKRTQTGTFVDRRGFHRARVLPIRSAITTAVADRFGDLWLTEHRTAPFSGTLTLSGAGIRKLLGGESVPAAAMLLHAGEKIRFTNQADPDTGAWGRDGRIAGVTYRAKDDSLTIAIDDRRDQFERILQRYGVLTDQLGGG